MNYDDVLNFCLCKIKLNYYFFTKPSSLDYWLYKWLFETVVSMRCLLLFFFTITGFTQLQCSLLSIGGKVKDEDISLLINAGLLVSQFSDPHYHLFTFLQF